MRTDAIRAAGGYDPDLFYEDFDLLLRLARDHEIEAVGIPLVRFRVLSDSLGHTEFSFTNRRFLRAMVRIYQKNVGVTSDADAASVPRLEYWILRLWFAGAPSSEILPLLKSLDRTVLGIAHPLWIALVRSRLPGRAFYGLASTTHRTLSTLRRFTSRRRTAD